MAESNETVEDIAAHYRTVWQGCENVDASEYDGKDILEIVDRIEAAHKREFAEAFVHNYIKSCTAHNCVAWHTVADLRRRLKVAEDALEACKSGMCGECHRQHPDETCICPNGCYEMSMAKKALAAIREEGGADGNA